MDRDQPKLVTKGKIALIAIALMVGVSIRPVREFLDAGSVSSSNLVSSGAALVIGVIIAFLVVRHANKPTTKDKP